MRRPAFPMIAVAATLAAAATLALSSCGSTGPAAVPDASSASSVPADDTAFLQSLLDGPGETIAIPAGDRPWQTDPLVFTGTGKTIAFARGCVIEAKKGSYADPGDCLLTVRGAKDVVISGYGATLRMRRDDYRAPPYEKGEWRHGVSLLSCENVRVEGLTVEETGGDGIYVGFEDAACGNIVLADLRLLKNYRQGVSVIAVRGFLMEGCVVTGTSGTLPMSGIDFEPNSGTYGLTGCVIRNCDFSRNRGAGIQLHLVKLDASHPSVDLLVENTRCRGNTLSVSINGLWNGISGSVVFRNCDLSPIKYVSKNKDFTVRFEKARPGPQSQPSSGS